MRRRDDQVVLQAADWCQEKSSAHQKNGATGGAQLIDTIITRGYHFPNMPDQTPRRTILGGLFVCFFLSGAAGLIYQVAWGKALGLVFGHTAYAVATVLAVFMGGLAAGSAWIGRWGDRSSKPLALYAWLEVGTALTGALSLAGLAGVRAVYFAAYPHAAAHDSILFLLRFAGA